MDRVGQLSRRSDRKVSMSTLAKLQDHLDTLALFPDRQDRIEALLALADEYKPHGPEEVPRTQECKVPGCESEVFVNTVKLPTGGLKFMYAVDNPQGISAMVMARILEDSLTGASKEEIASVSEDIVFEIFGKELSMGKNLGLTNMIRISKMYAQGQL